MPWTIYLMFSTYQFQWLLQFVWIILFFLPTNDSSLYHKELTFCYLQFPQFILNFMTIFVL